MTKFLDRKRIAFYASLSLLATLVACASATPEPSPTTRTETLPATAGEREGTAMTDSASGSTTAGFAPPTSPMPIPSYIVDVPTGTYKSAKDAEIRTEAQVLFLNEENAKKAFANKDELQKIFAEVFKQSKQDFKTASGKIAVKGEIMAKLNERGYQAEGVLWNTFKF